MENEEYNTPNTNNNESKASLPKYKDKALSLYFNKYDIGKIFRLLNDQLFILDKDTGTFKPVSSVPSIRRAQFKFLAKTIKKYLDDKFANLPSEKQLLNKIIDKVLLNPNLYSYDLLESLYLSNICIPLSHKSCYTDVNISLLDYAENKVFPIGSSKLTPNFNSIFYIKLNNDNIGHTLDYYHLLLYLNDSSPNILFYTKKLIENLTLNTSILNPKCFFIEYSNKDILNLYLEPILYKIPSDYKSFYSLENLCKPRNLINLTSKKLNCIKLTGQISTKYQKVLDNFILNKEYSTIDNKNVVNTTTFIICGSKKDFSDLCDISSLFKKEVLHIKLPDDIEDKTFFEPDLFDNLCWDNYSFIHLLTRFFEKVTDTNDFKVSEDEKDIFLNSFLQFWNECIEIVGNEKSPDSNTDIVYILKETLYSEYKKYCHDHGLETIANNQVGKIISQWDCFDKKMKLTEYKKSSNQKFFIDGKHPKENKNCYYGIKFKENINS